MYAHSLINLEPNDKKNCKKIKIPACTLAQTLENAQKLRFLKKEGSVVTEL